MAVTIRNRKPEGHPKASERASHKVVRREISIEPGRHLEPGSRDARLQEVEDRLLAKMIATHVNRQHALERLLHDVLDETNRETTARTFPLKGDTCVSKRLRRTEDLLVAAVIENHPNVARGLDRLLTDLFQNEANYMSNTFRDNDWDGLS